MTCIGSPHSCSAIKNEWRYASTSSHAFMVCVGLLLSSAQRENVWSCTFASPVPYGVRRDNFIRIARFCAPVAYLPSVVPKTWLAMPCGNSENSLKCFLPSPWSEVLILKISTSYEMICIFMNAKGNYHVYKRAPPAPVLSQMNPVHPLPCVFLLRPILLLSFINV
jgi:hypothetical protein